MTRQLGALLVVGILLLALIVGGWTVWKREGRQEAAAAFSSLAVCLVGGPERVAAEDASRIAYLLHYERDDQTLEACMPYRDALVKSRYVRYELHGLSQLAEHLMLGPTRHPRHWALDELWQAGESLPWIPPATLGGTPIAKTPVALTDAALLTACANPLAVRPVKLETQLDPYPPERVVVAHDGDFAVAVEDTPAKRLGRMVRVRQEKQSEPAPLMTTTSLKTPRPVVTALEGFRFWSDGTRLHATRSRDGVDSTMDVPFEPWQEIRSCRAASRRILGLEVPKEGTIFLYSLQSEELKPMGHVDRKSAVVAAGSVGSWSMDCDDDHVRIAWAVSEPNGKAELSSSGQLKTVPGGHQQIVVVTCEKAGCTQTTTRIELPMKWSYSLGPGADWYMNAVPVYALGKNVLLLWQESGSIWYRLAPLDELKRTANSWFANATWPMRLSPTDRCVVRSVNVQVLTRGGVALVNTTLHKEATEFGVVARFDGEGNAEAWPLLSLGP